MPQRGAPLATYSTATGDFRLDEDEARRRGLIPDGDRLPAKVARRLRTEAGLTTEQVTKAAADYGKLGDAKRGELLEAVAMARPRNLRAVAGDVFKSFDPDAEVEAEGADTALAGADYTELERPTPAPDPEAAPSTDTAALLEGRVGDVTDHLDRVAKTGGEGAARTAAAELLEAELAGKARKSLIAEL
jgi:hypothetical protein